MASSASDSLASSAFSSLETEPITRAPEWCAIYTSSSPDSTCRSLDFTPPAIPATTFAPCLPGHKRERNLVTAMALTNIVDKYR